MSGSILPAAPQTCVAGWRVWPCKCSRCAPEKTVTISSQSERRERDLQELFRRAKKPVALFIDDAHELHPKTLVALKRLIELVAEGGG